MKKLLATLLFLSSALFGADSFTTYSNTTTGSGTSVKLIGTGVTTHKLTYYGTGTIATCQVKLEQSVDNAAWSDLIAATTCTSNGSTIIATGTVNYIRITISTLTGGGELTVLYLGSATSLSTGTSADQVQGTAAAGATPVGNPVYIGGKDAGTNVVRPLAVDNVGNLGLISNNNQLDAVSNTSIGLLWAAAGVSNGLLVGPYVYNGTTWDRLRGTAAGGMQAHIMGASSGADALSNAQIGYLLTSGGTAQPVVNANTVFNGTTWDRMRGSTNGLSVASIFAGSDAVPNTSLGSIITSSGGFPQGALTPAAVGGFVFNGTTWDRLRNNMSNRTVSAVNTATATTHEVGNLAKSMAIHQVCSAGTASLTVDVSVDNSNFLTLDTIAAAATVIKQYTEVTVGAGIALSPLSFKYIRITTATCGVGNTSTQTVSIK